MIGPFPAAINTWLILFFKDIYSYECTITTYTGVNSQLLKYYGTYDVTAEAKKTIKIFKLATLTTYGISANLWRLTVSNGGLRNEQIVRGIFRWGY